MATIYRVCDGNTTLNITVTLTQGNCNYYQSVWRDGYENKYYRRQLTVTLSQAAPIAFNYNYLNTYVILRNGSAYDNGTYLESRQIPAGVTTYSWYETCKTVLGETYDDGTIRLEQVAQ